MKHAEIAQRAGVFEGDLDSLVTGQVTAHLAARLGVSMMDVESFIRGDASYDITARLGLDTMSAATELAQTIGRNGAVGVLIGLLLSR